MNIFGLCNWNSWTITQRPDDSWPLCLSILITPSSRCIRSAVACATQVCVELLCEPVFELNLATSRLD